jgi:DNA repair exonuclease SbcCD ATPase subunit
MILLKKTYVQNFFRVQEEQVFDMSDQGLVLIIGENADSSTADSNGSGKSTFFEAPLWCLKNRTVRGYTGDKVINRAIGKNCYVKQEFSKNGEEYTAVRYRKHKKFKNELHLFAGNTDITQKTVELTQEVIDEILGIDFESFIRGPMMPQGTFKRFSQMTDAESKKILDQIVKTDVFYHAQEFVKKQLKEIGIQSGGHASFASDLALTLSEAQEAIKDIQEKEDNFEKIQNLKIRNLNTEIASINGEIATLEENLTPIEDIEAKIKETEAILLDLEDNSSYEGIKTIQKLSNDVNKSVTTYQNSRSLHTISESELKMLCNEAKKIQNLEAGARCGTCYQKINSGHIEGCLADNEVKKEKATKKIKKAEKKKLSHWNKMEAEREKLAAARVEKEVFEANQKKTIKLTREILDEFKTYKQDNLTARGNIAHKEDIISLKKKDLKKLKNEKSPYSDILISKKAAYDKDLKKSNKHRTAVELFKSHKEYYEFWLKGFGNSGLKNLVLNSVAPFLNKRVKFYSKILTNGELEIEFNTKKTLKNGEVRDSFFVTVYNENGAEDYDGNSAGERGKADFAINFALSDLTSARSQNAFPQRFFDEPFDGLDALGLEAAVKLLQKMAEEAGSIFVITHNNDLKNLFNKVITVRKKDGITRIV